MFSGNHSPEVNVAFIMALTVVSTDTNSTCSTCTTNKNQLTRRNKINPVTYKYLCFHKPCRIQLGVHFKALTICTTYMNTWTVLGYITRKDQWCYNYDTTLLLHSGMGSRQFCRGRGRAAMSLTEARQRRGRKLETEARQTIFEARPRRGDPLKNLFPVDV